jgi:hypothetical protein
MTRSSLAATTLALGLIVFGSVACGDKPPPKPPESTPSSDTDGGGASTSSSDTDGGATTASTGGGDTKGAETPPAAPAGLALPSASAKIKFKAKKDFDLELKSDGTLNSGGKAAAKLTGMELQTPDGKSQLKVDGDGNITTADGAAYAKFDGDDLTAQNSAKYSIGDDGALTMTNEKGTKSNMGKADGVGSAKRASLLSVAFVMWGTKAPAAAGGGKKGGGDKPAGDKKGGGKKGDKK